MEMLFEKEDLIGFAGIRNAYRPFPYGDTGEIARLAGISKERARMALMELEDAGYIRTGGIGEDGRFEFWMREIGGRRRYADAWALRGLAGKCGEGTMRVAAWVLAEAARLEDAAQMPWREAG